MGPSTSILVTDIQNSTHLWEILQTDVMQRAVQLHHAVLRDKLRQFKGYETATEVGAASAIAHHSSRKCGRCIGLHCRTWEQSVAKRATATCDVKARGA